MIKYLDNHVTLGIWFDPIKGSNLRLTNCVCDVVSTVEASGIIRKWWDFYCIFYYAMKVFFYIFFKEVFHCIRNSGSKYLENLRRKRYFSWAANAYDWFFLIICTSEFYILLMILCRLCRFVSAEWIQEKELSGNRQLLQRKSAGYLSSFLL